MQRLPLANREEELALFDAMSGGTTSERILLLEARNTLGKSTLMKEFMRRSPDEVTCVPVDLKGGLGLDEILARLCDKLDWKSVPALMARIEELGRGIGQEVDVGSFEHVHRKSYDKRAISALMVNAFTISELKYFCWNPLFMEDLPQDDPGLPEFDESVSKLTQVMAVIEFFESRGRLDKLLIALREERFVRYKQYYPSIYGIEAQVAPGRATTRETGIGQVEIRDALRAADEGDRTARRRALTRALFDDLGARPGRVVFLFDTFDESSPEVRDWLTEMFLALAHPSADLVVVIAGQEVPGESIEWATGCQHRLLTDLDNAEAWHAYARSKGWDMPRAWIEAYCAATHGNPSQMDKLLLSAAQSGGSR